MAGNIDLESLYSRVGGDNELLIEIVDIFLVEFPKKLAKIERAIKEKDGERLQQSAHSLKANVAIFTNGKIKDMAFQLEKIGRENSLSQANDVYKIVRSEIKQLELELIALKKKIVG